MLTCQEVHPQKRHVRTVLSLPRDVWLHIEAMEAWQGYTSEVTDGFQPDVSRPHWHIFCAPQLVPMCATGWATALHCCDQQRSRPDGQQRPENLTQLPHDFELSDVQVVRRERSGYPCSTLCSQHMESQRAPKRLPTTRKVDSRLTLDLPYVDPICKIVCLFVEHVSLSFIHYDGKIYYSPKWLESKLGSCTD